MKRISASRILAILKSRFYYPFVFKEFGANTILESPLLITNPYMIKVGNFTQIRKGVRLEAILGSTSTPEIIVGSRCLIEQNVQIVARRRIIIGCDVSIAGNCAIVDVTHPYNSEGPKNIGYRIKDCEDEVIICDGCFIGFGSVILPGVYLGESCVVGANSVVTKSYGPRSVLAGSPAKLIKTY